MLSRSRSGRSGSLLIAIGGRGGLLIDSSVSGDSGVAAGSRHDGACGSSQRSDFKHVCLAERVLDEAGVELDDLLDGVVVCDTDVERVLDDHEGDALAARGGRERAAVLEDIGRLDLGDDVAEVDAALDVSGRAGSGDLGERGRQRRDDGRRVASADLEHEADDGELSGILGALVNAVDLQREVFATEVVLRGCVHVALDQVEGGVADSRGAVDNDFNGGAQVQELHFIGFGDSEFGLDRRRSDGVVCSWDMLGE